MCRGNPALVGDPMQDTKRSTAETVRTNRAVSPVIGVVMLVGVTVLLGAVVGALVLDLGNSQVDDDPLESEAPDATFRVSESGGEVTITHQAGDAVAAESLVVDGAVEGAPVTWGARGAVEPGDRLTVDASVENGTVYVVYEDLRTEKVLEESTY